MIQLLEKIKEALISVLPITLIVVILNFTPLVNLSNYEMLVFLVSALLLIIGIGLFNLGADMAMTPMGEKVGSGLTKSKSLPVVLIICFLLGLLITIAEPDLMVLASYVKSIVSAPLLIGLVGFGVAMFLVVAVIRMTGKNDLSSILMYLYMVLFALASIVMARGNGDLLALAFDSGGVTTGPITVPFIMALGVGFASVLSGKKSSENSFGVVALCSIGPILAVLVLGIFNTKTINYVPEDFSLSSNLLSVIGVTLWNVTKEVTIALGMVVIFFFIIQGICLKLPKKKLVQIGIGIVYTYLGLIIFLTSVNIGFKNVGYKIGEQLATSHPTLLAVFGFIIGLVVVLAEPAVHVLNKQVEEVTDGQIKKRSMLIALSVGVGISICLSVIRIIYNFSILYYLIPGYLISLGLSFFVPKIYTAIAFDSGGVASGPLTSTFILPFAIGACMALNGESGAAKVLTDAFGIVAMVAMTPLITIQLLGFKSVVTNKLKEKIAMLRILDADDEQIIDFE